jgi:hypothetical protein
MSTSVSIPGSQVFVGNFIHIEVTVLAGPKALLHTSRPVSRDSIPISRCDKPSSWQSAIDLVWILLVGLQCFVEMWVSLYPCHFIQIV